MKSTYETLRFSEARLRDVAGIVLDDLDRFYDEERSGVFRVEDGALVELLGVDKGAPEDQTLQRDWNWVGPALQAAYDQGRHDQLMESADEAIARAKGMTM